MTVPAVCTERLTKRFGQVTAVDSLDLSVEQGEVFGFLGPNGAGKSTTLRMLLHLLWPTAGAAWIMGVPASDVRRAHRHIGYVPGDVALWPQLTGEETLVLLGNLSGGVDLAFRQELLERFQLDPSVRVRSYSKGNRQKVPLVAALMTRPDVLLLDEPTSGLDPLMEAEFQAVVREAAARGQTVFLSSHMLQEVDEVCDRVGILRQGRLVTTGTLTELRELATTVLEVTFGGAPPVLQGIPGVTTIEPIPNGLRVFLQGSPAPLLGALVGAGVVGLRSHEQSLEEIFRGYYERGPS